MQVMNNFQIEGRIKEEIDKLLTLMNGYVTKDVGIHEMEVGILRQLLRLGLVLLVQIIEAKKLSLKGYRPLLPTGQLMKNKGLKSRKYLSLFGRLKFSRTRYLGPDSKSYYVLDEHLKFPVNSEWSYNLQEMIGENASENDFRESVRIFNKLLHLDLSGKSSERNSNRLGALVDAFYEQQPKDEEYGEKCFSASFDGKGVPKIKKKKELDGNPKKHLGKGEKKGTKQMATVSVTSCFVPKTRSKRSIIAGLMGSSLSKVLPDKQGQKDAKKNDNRWHEKIHRRAFLNDQAKAITYGLDDIRVRMKNPNSRFVVPIDAGIGLEGKVLAYVKKHNMEEQFDGIIIDIIHVSGYVWDAATAIFGEKSKLRADWVREMLEDILDSKIEKVIRDLKLIRDKTKLSENKLKQVAKTITYFENHQHNMDYKLFIEKGYPVSSALVESACGHLVKERMEQSGMRWSSKGAQNIMDLRAVKLNDDFDDFKEFVISQEHKTLSHLAA